MPEPIKVAITFKLADELVEEVRAVSPRIEILDFPGMTLGRGQDLSEADLAAARIALSKAEVVFGTNTMPMTMFDDATNLKWFQVITAGVDRMARDGLLRRGFTVTKVSGLASVPIAEYCMGTMVMLSKGLHLAQRDQLAHKWTFRWSGELRGKTCGIVGMGAIGREVAIRARAFGMRVVATRRRVEPGDSDPDCDALYPFTGLDTLLRESDYVVLCVPLTDETSGLLGAPEFAKMKPTASLVNIARGGVVDQEAMIAALKNGTIASAALDVFDPEPLPADSPLWDMENVIVTPHLSGAVERYGHRATEIFIRNLRHYVAGEPLELVVDPVLAY